MDIKQIQNTKILQPIRQKQVKSSKYLKDLLDSKEIYKINQNQFDFGLKLQYYDDQNKTSKINEELETYLTMSVAEEIKVTLNSLGYDALKIYHLSFKGMLEVHIVNFFTQLNVSYTQNNKIGKKHITLKDSWLTGIFPGEKHEYLSISSHSNTISSSGENYDVISSVFYFMDDEVETIERISDTLLDIFSQVGGILTLTSVIC
ncbi:UNKNOWN [Stylonychia lemnae]|uniref:Uncharacterized protein n=1 Tax=Stylonychia lemnae TaxID=5949 RepID=A0A078ADQ7_STYLE|nr:UNKNOWN [Stylonychia lemnae]|eukprot:CDW80359.1 UNKNOWN [Stylonychia lemnae]